MATAQSAWSLLTVPLDERGQRSHTGKTASVTKSVRWLSNHPGIQQCLLSREEQHCGCIWSFLQLKEQGGQESSWGLGGALLAGRCLLQIHLAIH